MILLYTYYENQSQQIPGRHQLEDMFHAKYLSSSSFAFQKKKFFSVAMATRVLNGIKFFKQFLKVTTKKCSLK
jgi:hypothetical protein